LSYAKSDEADLAEIPTIEFWGFLCSPSIITCPDRVSDILRILNGQMPISEAVYTYSNNRAEKDLKINFISAMDTLKNHKGLPKRMNLPESI
jgi:hypothetical protein